MGDDITGTSPALNTQPNPELNEHTLNTNQKSNYVKTQSLFIPPIQNKTNNKLNSQTGIVNNSLNNINDNDTNPKSFAETTANKHIPKMNQAMVLTAIEGIKQIDYLTAISQFTAATNIIAASRISN